MSVPVPKELVRLAWNARVGWDCDRCLTHFALKILVKGFFSLCLLVGVVERWRWLRDGIDMYVSLLSSPSIVHFQDRYS